LICLTSLEVITAKMIPLGFVGQTNNPTPFAGALNAEEPHHPNFHHGKGKFEPRNDVIVTNFISVLGEDDVECEHHCSGSCP